MSTQPPNELTPMQVFATLTKQNAEANDNTRRALEELATERKRFADAHAEAMQIHTKYIDLLDRHIAQSKVLMLDVLEQVKSMAAPPAPVVYEYLRHVWTGMDEITESEKRGYEVCKIDTLMVTQNTGTGMDEDVCTVVYMRKPLTAPTAPDADDTDAEAPLSPAWENALPDDEDDGGETEPVPVIEPDTLEPDAEPAAEPTPEPEPAHATQNDVVEALAGHMESISIEDAFVVQGSARIFVDVDCTTSGFAVQFGGKREVKHIRQNPDPELDNEFTFVLVPCPGEEHPPQIVLETPGTVYVLREGAMPDKRMLTPAGPGETIVPMTPGQRIGPGGVIWDGPRVSIGATLAAAKEFGQYAGRHWPMDNDTRTELAEIIPHEVDTADGGTIEPESVLPVNVVQGYQDTRAWAVEATGEMLDIAAIMRSGSLFPAPTVNGMGNVLTEQLLGIRVFVLQLMATQLEYEAENHILHSQLTEISEKHNELVDALEHGDLTHDLTDAFLQEIHDSLEMEWTSDLINAIQRSQQIPARVASALLDAIEGNHVPVEHRAAVAQLLVRAGAQVAGTIEESEKA